MGKTKLDKMFHKLTFEYQEPDENGADDAIIARFADDGVVGYGATINEAIELAKEMLAAKLEKSKRGG